MRQEKWAQSGSKRKEGARKVWQEKWGVKSKARKVGHKEESEKWGEKSGAKRKEGLET